MAGGKTARLAGAHSAQEQRAPPPDPQSRRRSLNTTRTRLVLSRLHVDAGAAFTFSSLTSPTKPIRTRRVLRLRSARTFAPATSGRPCAERSSLLHRAASTIRRHGAIVGIHIHISRTASRLRPIRCQQARTPCASPTPTAPHPFFVSCPRRSTRIREPRTERPRSKPRPRQEPHLRLPLKIASPCHSFALLASVEQPACLHANSTTLPEPDIPTSSGSLHALNVPVVPAPFIDPPAGL
jgi:hypothetical protein